MVPRRGLGYAIAQHAAACGAKIAICDLKQSEVVTAAAKIDPAAIGLAADISQEEECESTVARTVAKFGKINVLVNNAGIFEEIRGTAKQDFTHWRRVIDVNLQGSYLMARAAARAMKRGDPANSIINFASVNGLTGFRASNAYGVSKAAVAMLTQNLATDLASRGIRVNAVAPGFINTAMTDMIFGEMGVEKEVFLRRIPMGRFGEAPEIAKAVVFLASPWASYITGAVLPVDGGWCAFGGPGNASEPQ
jgi:NAD(P)-dependent dehydrogenase (short-subunit alcohol dehydrogenase family)